MVMLTVYLLIALGFSFLCSVLEAVVLSITPAYVAAQSGSGSAFGKRLTALKQDIDRPLAAILTLNTFAHTIGAAGVGAQAQRLWGQESLSVVSAVVTILILIGSEIIPKTLGAVYWQRLAKPAIATIRVLTMLLLPFVWVSQLLTKLLRHGHQGSVLARADIRNVIHYHVPGSLEAYAQEAGRGGFWLEPGVSGLVGTGFVRVPERSRPTPTRKP